MAITTHKITFEKDSLKKVTVFEDRAELKREFTVDLVAGLNEVVIEKISHLVVDDSVRVTGKGNAVIEEVQVCDRRTTTGSNDSDRASEVRAEKEELEKKKKIVDDERTSIQNRINAFDAMINQVGNGIAAPKDSKFSADGSTLESISTFFAFYDQESTKLRGAQYDRERESIKLQEEINVKEDLLNQLTCINFAKVITILLESTEGGPVVLELTHQVWGCNWRPFYDIRVETKEDKTEMQLSYYGNVNQSCGDDWEGAELILSTARPCIGGSIPELGTLDVSFYRPPPPQPVAMAFGGHQVNLKSMKRSVMREECAPMMDAAPMMMDRVATVNSQTLSTEFAITRPCSIPSDGTDHKVTIGIITLSPQLVHESVPSKNSSAFLTANCLNSSSLPLLPGQASIYLDGAFVAKSDIKAVSPGERFRSSLGVDPAVKIDYKPVHKYHETTGLINKSSSTVHEQKIIVKNTRGDAVLLTIKDQIPRSTDEKIKVRIISPESIEKVTEENSGENDHAPKAGIRQMPSNNLEWTVKLDKGASQTLLIKYAIEHPSTEKLDFQERFN